MSQRHWPLHQNLTVESDSHRLPAVQLRRSSPFTFTSHPTSDYSEVMVNLAKSSAAQSAIEKLPAETLAECLRLLPIDVAKSARLVCRRWSDSIARWLFHRVYFRPHPDIMKTFEQITSNPLYAVGITELVYDARVFLSVSYLTGVKEKQNNRLFREQQDILDQAVDLQHLISGLERLPNLKSVQVLEKFGSYVTCISTGKRDNFRQYNNWCQRLWKTLDESVNPSASIITRGATQPWNARGVENLFQALTMRRPQLLHLCCGGEHSGLPLKLLDAGISSTLFHHLAPSLTCLSVVDEESWSVSEDSQHLQLPAKSIMHAQKLKFLSLNMWNMAGIDLGTVLSGALWPNLSSLTLWQLHFLPESLIALCYSHKDTLQQLALNAFRLKSSDKMKSWEDVCQELGSFLRLHYIRIFMPFEKSAELYPSVELSHSRVEGLVRSIMRWVPQGMLKKESYDVVRLRTSSLSLPLRDSLDTGLGTLCGCNI